MGRLASQFEAGDAPLHTNLRRVPLRLAPCWLLARFPHQAPSSFAPTTIMDDQRPSKVMAFACGMYVLRAGSRARTSPNLVLTPFSLSTGSLHSGALLLSPACSTGRRDGSRVLRPADAAPLGPVVQGLAPSRRASDAPLLAPPAEASSLAMVRWFLSHFLPVQVQGEEHPREGPSSSGACMLVLERRLTRSWRIALSLPLVQTPATSLG